MNDTSKQTLALFDFDGTITHKDSFMEFLKYAVGLRRIFFAALRLSPLLIAYKAKLIPTHNMKERITLHFFKNREEKDFIELARRFAETFLPGDVKASAMDRITRHKKQGHHVVVVSASFSHWLKPWCDNHDLDLIATELEVKEHTITGKFATPNCNGPEKVVRIKAAYPPETYHYGYAYGNSKGDRPMLDLADESFYRNFE